MLVTRPHIDPPGRRPGPRCTARPAGPRRLPQRGQFVRRRRLGRVLIWVIAFVGSLTALYFAFTFFKQMMAADEGTPRMIEIAGYVREGANAYLRQQYKVVGVFFVLIVLVLAFFAYGLGVQSKWVPFAFLTGGFFSGLAGWFGMKTATLGQQPHGRRGPEIAEPRPAGRLPLRGGDGPDRGRPGAAGHHALVCLARAGASDMPLTEITVTMLCFGMGASAQALFARVGGGIFTKAADVGADLVGKVEQGIPEDDPRNPATIADNVGDNVGDVAGMGADLYESYCGSILATAAWAWRPIRSSGVRPWGLSQDQAQLQALLLPMAIAAVGIFLSILGIFMVRTNEDATQKNLLKALARGINLSTAAGRRCRDRAGLVADAARPKARTFRKASPIPGVRSALSSACWPAG